MTPAAEIEGAVQKTFDEKNLSMLSINSIATVDLKAREPGLREFASKYHLDIKSFGPDALNSVAGVERSEAAFRATGAHAVAEPAAILAARNGRLLVGKQRMRNVTVAVAEYASPERKCKA
jgi:cobalt-precorrin 5A hydrolase